MLATSSRTTDRTVRDIARNNCWRHVSAVRSRRSGALPCEAFGHRISPSPNRYCLATMASTILADAAVGVGVRLHHDAVRLAMGELRRPLDADPLPVGTVPPTLRWSRSWPSRRPTGPAPWTSAWARPPTPPAGTRTKKAGPSRAFGNASGRCPELPSPRCARSSCRAVDRGQTETRRLHAPPVDQAPTVVLLVTATKDTRSELARA